MGNWACLLSKACLSQASGSDPGRSAIYVRERNIVGRYRELHEIKNNLVEFAGHTQANIDLRHINALLKETYENIVNLIVSIDNELDAYRISDVISFRTFCIHKMRNGQKLTEDERDLFWEYTPKTILSDEEFESLQELMNDDTIQLNTKGIRIVQTICADIDKTGSFLKAEAEEDTWESAKHPRDDI